MNRMKRDLPLHLMLLPASIILLIYAYGPMVGLIMAFEDYNIVKGMFGSKWVGFDNYVYALQIPDTLKVLWNTVFIALMKIIAKLLFPLILALLLNEVAKSWFKKTVQTVTYFPYLISWVVLSGIFLDFFSPTDGVVNVLLSSLGLKSIYFLGDAKWFPYMMAITDLWKDIGFNTIILLAALTNIDPSLYEAATVDGAGRWKQTVWITIPGVSSMMVLLTVLGLANILNAGFDQIFNLYSPIVYSSGDILDTMVYRLGLEQSQFSLATAIGLFKSVVSLFMMLTANSLARKYTDNRIF